jgi:predicted MFS family arabinose efflux permease
MRTASGIAAQDESCEMEKEARGPRHALWALLLGNFIIGTGVLLPAGLLNAISSDLDVSAATAGQLMLVGGMVVAIGAPVTAGLTSQIDRRLLLSGSLMIYVAGHLASAIAPDFMPLLVLRALTVVAAAIFTPQAAATAGLLVTPQARAGAIAFIFIGWSAASVAGIPLGSYLSNLFGWRLVFVGMGLASAIAACLVLFALPAGLHVQKLNGAAWMQAFRSPLVLLVLAVTLLSMSGQMTVFTYIAPILKEAFAAGPEQVSMAFAVAGIAGVAGNALASRVVGAMGVDRVIAIAITCLILGIGLFASSFGLFWMACVGIAIWGVGSFSSNSLQQSRLVALAPHLAAATVALNTSVVYLGQAVGAGLGGWFMAETVTPSIAWTACGLTVFALAASLVATRLARI